MPNPQSPEWTAQLKSQFRCGVYTATHECVVPLCQGLPFGTEGSFVRKPRLGGFATRLAGPGNLACVGSGRTNLGLV